VRFVGHVPKADLPELYRRASVFVLPSLADSYGLVTLEAMACGLPVIVTENCGSKEAVREGVDGFVVPIRDPQALATALRRLYDDPDRRHAMGRVAATRAREFTWERYGDRLLAVYDRILGRATTTPEPT
jgi:glycosyltransferase involved in cell wall biosynthesis